MRLAWVPWGCWWSGPRCSLPPCSVPWTCVATRRAPPVASGADESHRGNSIGEPVQEPWTMGPATRLLTFPSPTEAELLGPRGGPAIAAADPLEGLEVREDSLAA